MLRKISAAVVSGIALLALSACAPQIDPATTPTEAQTSAAPETAATSAAPETSAPASSSTGKPATDGPYCVAVQAAFDSMTDAGEQLQSMGSDPTKLPEMGALLTATSEKLGAAAALAEPGESKDALEMLQNAYADLGKAASDNDVSGITEAASAMSEEEFMNAATKFGMDAAMNCGVSAS